MKSLVAVAALFVLALTLNDRAFSATADPWKGLSFLEGTWIALAQAGSAKAQVSGTYTFKTELKHHVVVRRSDDSAACKGAVCRSKRNGSPTLSGRARRRSDPWFLIRPPGFT